MRSSPPMTAPPAAPSRRSPRKASPARCRCRARTATRRRSTASRSARRPCRCGRTRANSASTAAEVALQLADGKKMTEIKGVDGVRTAGRKKQAMKAIFLTPVPITKDNLNVVIDAGLDHEGRGLPGRETRHGARPATEAERQADAPTLRTRAAVRVASRGVGPRSSPERR